MSAYDEIKDFLNGVFISDEDIHPAMKELSYTVRLKGYGTPEMEMKFLHKFFMYIIRLYPDFDKFSWEQSNDYNDEHYRFSLMFFHVNDKQSIHSDIDFYFMYHESESIISTAYLAPNDSVSQEELSFARDNNLDYNEFGLKDEGDKDRFYEYYQEKQGHLALPSLRLVVFLKLLEISLGSYYFLYVFGNGVRVEFTREGVKIIDLQGEQDGLDLGAGMYLEDL